MGSIDINGEILAKNQWVLLQKDVLSKGEAYQIIGVAQNELELNRDLEPSILNQGSGLLSRLIPISQQPDYPLDSGGNQPLPSAGDVELIYLDVWERHITSIEDPEIKEPALGGPDTDTRTKVITQVKKLSVSNAEFCDETMDEWEDLIQQRPILVRGRLRPHLGDLLWRLRGSWSWVRCRIWRQKDLGNGCLGLMIHLRPLNDHRHESYWDQSCLNSQGRVRCHISPVEFVVQ